MGFHMDKTCVCETRMFPAVTNTKLAIFDINVTIKVTMSLTMVSFARVSFVEYACQI